MRGRTNFLILLCFTLSVVTLIAAGCESTGTVKSDSAYDLDRRNNLRVGITTDYPPLIFKEDGKIQGVEADLARQLGDRMRKLISFREMKFHKLIPALESGEIDVIMAGLSVTDERKQRVLYTEPYMQVGQMAIIRKSDMLRFGRPKDLYEKKARVGFVRNTTGEIFVRENLPHAERAPVNTVGEGLNFLREEVIDIFVHDAPTAWRIAEVPSAGNLIALYWPLTEEDLAWAVRKNDTTLHSELNGILSEWKRNGRLQNILNRWIRITITLKPN